MQITALSARQNPTDRRPGTDLLDSRHPYGGGLSGFGIDPAGIKDRGCAVRGRCLGSTDNTKGM